MIISTTLQQTYKLTDKKKIWKHVHDELVWAAEKYFRTIFS